MGPKILIDDGRVETWMMRAMMMGLAGGMGFDSPPMRRREDYAPKFTWEENSKSYPRTEERKSRIKKMRRKKRARKSKRGY